MSVSAEAGSGRARAPRYVSLCPSITHALFELGVGGRVVGATRFCVDPEEPLAQVPRVGGTKDPRVDEIAALAPDLVFMNEEENRLEDFEAIEARGLRVHRSMPRCVDDVPAMLRSFGAATGAVAQGEELAGEVEEAARGAREAARAASRGSSGRPRATFVVLVWRKPWIAASADTFLSSVLEVAGGTNAIPSTGGRYPTLTSDEIAALDPSRVFLPSEPFPFGPRHVRELAEQTRIDPSRFVLCDGRALTWHGPLTAAALRDARGWFARDDDVGRAPRPRP